MLHSVSDPHVLSLSSIKLKGMDNIKCMFELYFYDVLIIFKWIMKIVKF